MTHNLTQNKDGVILNLSNFKKLFSSYNKSKFNGGITSLARTSKILLTNWHVGNQYRPGYSDKLYGQEIADESFVLYTIADNHIQIMSPDTVHSKHLKSSLGLTNNTDLIQYLVEEFIIDFICYANRSVVTDLTQFKQEVNAQYFNHAILLQSKLTTDRGIPGTSILVAFI